MIQYRIGCSGFYNKHWKGVFYPLDIAQNKWFSFYCEHFNTLELNTTFYRFPRLEMLQEWWIKSPVHFRMSVKAPRAITHLRRFRDCQLLIDDFYDVCEKGLKDKLGALLFQLPPSIKYSEELLEHICRSLRPGFANIVEFRHESWWREDVYAIMKSYGIVFCSVSHPSLPDQVVVNAGTAYIRLHGVPDMFYSPYTTEQMQELLRITADQEGLEEVYIYFNNTAGTAGILNAMELRDLAASQIK
jgi:uncharacterized protein YecE (DUF72 family)